MRRSGLPKTPPRLAEPSSLAESKTGRGCHPVDENICSPNGVTQTGPGFIGCDEMLSVLQLIGIGDLSSSTWSPTLSAVLQLRDRGRRGCSAPS